jgi:hypothetical protein
MRIWREPNQRGGTEGEARGELGVEVLKMNENIVTFPEGASPRQKKKWKQGSLRQETSGEIVKGKQQQRNI